MASQNMNFGETTRDSINESPANTSREGVDTSSDLGSDWSVAVDTSDGGSSFHSFEIIEREISLGEAFQETHEEHKSENRDPLLADSLEGHVAAPDCSSPVERSPKLAPLRHLDLEAHTSDALESESDASSDSSQTSEDMRNSENSDDDTDSELDEDVELGTDTELDEDTDFDENSDLDEETDFDEDSYFDEETDFEEDSDLDEDSECDEDSDSEDDDSDDSDSTDEEYHSSDARWRSTSLRPQDQKSWAELTVALDSSEHAAAHPENLQERVSEEDASVENPSGKMSASVESRESNRSAWGYLSEISARTSQGPSLCALPEASHARNFVDFTPYGAPTTSMGFGGLGVTNTSAKERYDATSLTTARPRVCVGGPVTSNLFSQQGSSSRDQGAGFSVSTSAFHLTQGSLGTPMDPNAVADRVHEDLTLRDSIPTFECPVCPCVFTTEKKLNEHLRQHAERTPYACARCLVAVDGRQQMYHHLRSHLLDSHLVCQFCDLYFATRSQLFSHRVEQVCLAPILVDDKWTRRNYQQAPSIYSCSRCPQQFASASDIEIHQGWHDRYIVHVCSSCERSFSSLAEYLAHQREHLERDIHRCPECDARFPYRDDLTKHAEIYGSMERLAEDLSNQYQMQASQYIYY